MTPYFKSQRSVSNHGLASFWKTIVSSFEAKASSRPCVDPAIVQYTMQVASSMSYPGVTPWKTTKKMPKHRYPAEKYHALGSFPTSRNSTFFTAFTNFLRAGNKKSSLLSGTSGLFKHCSDEGKWDGNLKYKGSIEFAPSQFTKKIERSSVKNCFSTTLT